MKVAKNLIPIVFLFCLYALIAPLYIQGGDTAEMVNASYHLYVPHPPGYPLYSWLQHFWLTLTSFSTIFHRASLLSVLFSLATFALLIYPLRKKVLLITIPFVFLGLSPDFVESAVLPDVFSLHGLFIAAIMFAFLYDFKGKHFLLPFLFALSITNHHTTILLLPVLIYELKEFKRSSWLGLLSGGIVCSLFYLSLLMFDHSHPYSWGNIKDLSSLLDHFLRKDYGTFSLSARGENKGIDALIFLLKSLTPGLVILGCMLVGKRSLLSDRRFLMVLLVLLLSFGFALMGNIAPIQAGEEVLKRFHVMPLVIVASMTVYVVQLINLSKNLKILILLITFITSAYQGFQLKDFLNLRNDSVIEDYSRNLFEGAKRNSPALIYAASDTAFFGIRYISSFSGDIYQQKIAVMSPEIFFHPWFNQKIRLLMPQFDLLNKERIYQQKRLNIDNDIIRPNLKHYNFLVTSNYKDGTWYKLVFLPLGRLMKEGQGTFFDDTGLKRLQLHYRPDQVPSGPQHFTKGFFFYQYSHQYMAKAFQFWDASDFIHARLEWEKAIQLVPFALPARINLCQHYPNEYNFCQEENLKKLENETKGFF